MAVYISFTVPVIVREQATLENYILDFMSMSSFVYVPMSLPPNAIVSLCSVSFVYFHVIFACFFYYIYNVFK